MHRQPPPASAFERFLSPIARILVGRHSAAVEIPVKRAIWMAALAAIAGAGLVLGGDAPAALIGTWGVGTVSGTTFVNRATGSYSDPSGTQVQYKFFSDGRYEYAALTTQSMYSCTTRFMTFKTGVVLYQGNELTFVPQTSKFTSQDTCSARNNYEKPAGLERETYRWRVKRDESGQKMCLQNAKIDGCAYRR
jgi:hypothetical protein